MYKMRRKWKIGRNAISFSEPSPQWNTLNPFLCLCLTLWFLLQVKSCEYMSLGNLSHLGEQLYFFSLNCIHLNLKIPMHFLLSVCFNMQTFSNRVNVFGTVHYIFISITCDCCKPSLEKIFPEKPRWKEVRTFLVFVFDTDTISELNENYSKKFLSNIFTVTKNWFLSDSPPTTTTTTTTTTDETTFSNQTLGIKTLWLIVDMSAILSLDFYKFIVLLLPLTQKHYFKTLYIDQKNIRHNFAMITPADSHVHILPFK